MTTTTQQSPVTRGGDGLGALIGAKVFVAGGSSGMGAAVARMAAARGARVAVAGRDAARLAAVAAGLKDRALTPRAPDLADAASVEAALAADAPWDHIVCAAADLTFKPIVDLTDAEIGRMLDTKFWGPVNIARAAARHLAPGGSLIFLSGLAAYRQSAGSTIVGALNMALESFAAGLAIELKPRRVNVISPGVVDTPLWSGLPGQERRAFYDSVGAGQPAGRVGAVEDIAHAAVSLMENGYITGAALHVDGGGHI